LLKTQSIDKSQGSTVAAGQRKITQLKLPEKKYRNWGGIELIPHTTYSTDLATLDYH
jgi:hypothetical protein